VSDGDRMSSSTQVTAVRSTWLAAALSYQARNSIPLFLEDLALVDLPELKARAWLLGSRVCSGLSYEAVLWWRTCGEVLSIHACRDEMENQYGSLLDLILFWLAAPPLQLGEVGPYLV
jgi:hypothetical protein